MSYEQYFLSSGCFGCFFFLTSTRFLNADYFSDQFNQSFHMERLWRAHEIYLTVIGTPLLTLTEGSNEFISLARR